MAIFALGIGVSAFLLFWLEPLIGQIVLPLFGGTPAVWATVLVFFQGTLLLGYLYGHASVTRLGPRQGAALHVALAVAALAWLVLQPGNSEPIEAGALPATLDVLRVLALRVGPPVFVLTATTPMMSAWYVARRRGTTGRDPYGLYALSNAASLGALLAYPFLIGPTVGLSSQLSLWTAGFAVLSGIFAVAAMVVWRASRASYASPRPGPQEAIEPLIGSATETPEDTDHRDIGWKRRGRWLLLASIPAGLLAAVTNFIAVDLIAAPLLWIGPLVLYLGSFIVAFSERGRRWVPGAVLLAPAVVTLLWVPIGSAGGWPLIPLIAIEWGAFAIIATALHGRLAQDRPRPRRLTEFYLVQSVGGVGGGAFVGVLAPSLFPGIWEYPILLAGALAALALTASRPIPGSPSAPISRSARRRLNFSPFFVGARMRVGPYVAVAAVVVAIMAAEQSVALEVAVRWILFGGLILLVGAQPRFLAAATGLALTIATLVIPVPALLRDRSFFGVTEVIRSSEEQVTVLMNGTTVHGIQSTDPALARRPYTYYAASGPLGDVFAWLDAARPNASIAVVGLGAGTIAAYEQPGQALTFFEIDPLVVRVATDPHFFTYLSDAPSTPAIVLGDARLSLRSAASGSFDLLVLDAFSSDAIPAHLLTLEALADDLRVLRAGGLMAVHISNRYYDLAPALSAAGRELGLVVLDKGYNPTPAEAEAGAAISYWVVLLADPSTADPFLARGWKVGTDTGERPLTDDHPDILRFLSIRR